MYSGHFWRGGSFRDNAVDCRSAATTDYGLSFFPGGFRAVLLPHGIGDLDVQAYKGKTTKAQASLPAATTNLPLASGGDYLVIDVSGGSAATSYPVSHLVTLPAGGWGDDYKTTRIVLRRISAGTFMMGAPRTEVGAFIEPLHQVTLTKDFYIGVFTVTQKQWERVMGTWPSYFTNIIYRDARPVERVSYTDIRGAKAGSNWPSNNTVDATSFMGVLRARTGLPFDLPTEAQWEYACRAGTTTALNSGFDLDNALQDAHMDLVGRYWFNSQKSCRQDADNTTGTSPVGSYLPNAWGLYDMHGNVWQWCLDWICGDYSSPQIDPKGNAKQSCRMCRGGAWNYGALNCRAAFSGGGYVTPDCHYDFHGFRIVLVSD